MRQEETTKIEVKLAQIIVRNRLSRMSLEQHLLNCLYDTDRHFNTLSLEDQIRLLEKAINQTAVSGSICQGKYLNDLSCTIFLDKIDAEHAFVIPQEFTSTKQEAILVYSKDFLEKLKKRSSCYLSPVTRGLYDHTQFYLYKNFIKETHDKYRLLMEILLTTKENKLSQLNNEKKSIQLQVALQKLRHFEYQAGNSYLQAIKDKKSALILAIGALIMITIMFFIRTLHSKKVISSDIANTIIIALERPCHTVIVTAIFLYRQYHNKHRCSEEKLKNDTLKINQELFGQQRMIDGKMKEKSHLMMTTPIFPDTFDPTNKEHQPRLIHNLCPSNINQLTDLVDNYIFMNLYCHKRRQQQRKQITSTETLSPGQRFLCRVCVMLDHENCQKIERHTGSRPISYFLNFFVIATVISQDDFDNNDLNLGEPNEDHAFLISTP